jgi:hypothetical protein
MQPPNAFPFDQCLSRKLDRAIVALEAVERFSYAWQLLRLDKRRLEAQLPASALRSPAQRKGLSS